MATCFSEQCGNLVVVMIADVDVVYTVGSEIHHGHTGFLMKQKTKKSGDG